MGRSRLAEARRQGNKPSVDRGDPRDETSSSGLLEGGGIDPRGRRGAGEMDSGGEQGPDGGTRGTAVGGGHRGVHVQGRGGVCPPDASNRGAGTAQAAPTGIERLERGDGEAGGGGMPDTHGNARQEVHVVGLPTDMGRSDCGVRGSAARAQRDQGEIATAGG